MIHRRNIPYLLIGFIVSAILVAFRFNTLNLPFYWDEAWVYGPALKKMGENYCLLPSCSSEYTRGHPLLFHALGGAWIKLFGDSLFAIRSFALAIALLLQWSSFYIGSKLFNPLTGLIISALIVAQNLIFAQATSVFPELLLALLSLWTVFFYLKGKRTQYIVFGILTCLVKEHGVVLILSIFIWDVIQKTQSEKQKIFSFRNFLELFLVALPVTGLLAFFLIQKLQKGYFFFPEHMDMINGNSQGVIYQFRIASNLLFAETGRILLLVIFLLVFLIAGKPYRLGIRALVVASLFCLIKIVSGKWGFPDWLVLISGAGLIILIIYCLVFSNRIVYDQMKIFGPAIIFIVGYLVFSSFNFFTDRYIACLVPFLVIWFAGSMNAWLKQNVWVFAATGTFMFAGSLFFLITDKGYGDTSPGNYNAILLQQDVINYMKKENLRDKKILTSFIMANNMVLPEAGFVSKSESFSNVTSECNNDARPEYITEFTFDTDSCRNSVIKRNGFILLKEFKRGNLTGEIYFNSETRK